MLRAVRQAPLGPGACGSEGVYDAVMRRSIRLRMMTEQEDKYEVDPDWVLPQLTELVPGAGRLVQERCASSTTPISTHQVRGCGFLASHFDTESAALKLAGS